MIEFVENDGGRSQYFKGKSVRDCVARSIAIASGKDYLEVYNRLAEGNANQRQSKRSKTKTKSAINGINVKRKWFKDYMQELGFEWRATMSIGSGCKVHLREGELPKGRLVVNVTRHSTAVIDGVLHDTHDCSRGGQRCVFGYWILIQQ